MRAGLLIRQREELEWAVCALAELSPGEMGVSAAGVASIPVDRDRFAAFLRSEVEVINDELEALGVEVER